VGNSVSCIRNLESAGITVMASRDDEIYCLCPFHSDSRTSMSVNWQKEVWFCFAGCGGGTLNQLWRRLNYEPNDENDVELRLELSDDPPIRIQCEELSDRLIRYISSRLSKINDNELIVTDLCDRFNIKKTIIDVERFLIQTNFEAIVFPSKRLDGDIVGYATQCPDQKAVCVGKAKKACFGLCETQGGQGPLVIVEGAFDALCVYLCGFKVAALFGCSMSRSQLHQILASTDDIVLFLDSDAPGRVGTDKIVSMMANEYVNPRVVSWGRETKKDPADLSRKEIIEHIRYALQGHQCVKLEV